MTVRFAVINFTDQPLKVSQEAVNQYLSHFPDLELQGTRYIAEVTNWPETDDALETALFTLQMDRPVESRYYILYLFYSEHEDRRLIPTDFDLDNVKPIRDLLRYDVAAHIQEVFTEHRPRLDNVLVRLVRENGLGGQFNTHAMATGNRVLVFESFQVPREKPNLRLVT